MKKKEKSSALSKKNVGMPNLINVPPLEISFESLDSLIEKRKRSKDAKR